MVETTDDINYDYINQKLLYLLLIRGCSLVIRPFEYDTKLDGLFELLRAFYIIEEIDMGRITEPSHLEGYFSSYDDSEKKSIILLKNVTQGTMDEVMKYPEILFIALEKDQSIDYSQFQKIAVFNKKTKKISKLIPKSQISANSLAYKWVGEKIISDLKSLGIIEVKDYLSRIYEKICSLFDLLPAISKQLYQYFGSELTPQEQKVVIAICGHYYNVKLPEYTKKTIKQKKMELEKVDEKLEIKIETKENLEKVEKIEKQKEQEIELEQELIEAEPSDETLNYNENQFNQEIWELINTDNGSSGYNALSLVLSDIKIDSKEKFSTPEKKYIYLRSNQWKTQIPFEFFKKLFLCYVQEEIKNDKVHKSNFNYYLRDKHDHMISICSMVASPEFKQMDPTQFAGDEILKSYLKKEPMVSNVLPVQNNRKSVSPKELGKLFSHDSVSPVEHHDFNTQYQKNLERLKNEYGERTIDSELVVELRNRTKELQSKISALFQD